MSVAEILNAVWNILSKVPLPAALFSLAIITLPENLLIVIGVDRLKTDPELRQLVGIIFLGSTVLLFAQGITFLRNFAGKQLEVRQKNDTQVAFLRKLTDREKSYLKKFVESRDKTKGFKFNDGLVRGLEKKGIIFQSSELSPGIGYASFNINDWAYDCLVEHPELLDGASGEAEV